MLQGTQLRYPGLGDDSQSELPRGNLFVHIEANRHPKFVRENISLINSLKDFEKKIKKKSTFPISVSSSSKILKNFFKELNYSNE